MWNPHSTQYSAKQIKLWNGLYGQIQTLTNLRALSLKSLECSVRRPIINAKKTCKFPNHMCNISPL